MSIKYVIDTHVHADHHSSGRAAGLRAQPDHLVVLPGAFFSSVCGRGSSGNPVSTIGFERRHNTALGVTDRDAFIAYMLRDTPPRPPDALRVRAANPGLESASV